MGRRGRVGEMGGDMVWHGKVVVVEQTIPHSDVVDANWEGYLGSEWFQPKAR